MSINEWQSVGETVVVFYVVALLITVAYQWRKDARH